MTLSTQDRALAVYHRFGFGPRPGDLATVNDPRAALHAEIAQGDAILVGPDAVSANGLVGTPSATQTTLRASEARRALGTTAAAALEADANPAGRSETAADAARSKIALLKEVGSSDARLLRSEALVRFRKACYARIGFGERLVTFWSNHFCVSMAKGELAHAVAGPFEREAIRPFVLGRFADMLIAVVHHPAMLTYLDNAQSIGPHARGNTNGKRGLNENLAREILELHTIGADGGYSQADVTAFARVLTGWTVAGRDGRLGDPGAFAFDANSHEPGDASILGRMYPGSGYGQAEAALTDLARHPATIRHVATKLVRHFLADDPPKSAVDRIVTVFTKTDGDLRAVSLALTDLPEAWATPATKLRNPYDFLVAVNRLLERLVNEPWSLMSNLKQLGMPLWQPGGPNGFPDIASAWASPEGMKLRLDLSAEIAHKYLGDRSPMDLLDAAFGAAVSADTKAAVTGAESREQAIALILMAPEFQRR